MVTRDPEGMVLRLEPLGLPETGSWIWIDDSTQIPRKDGKGKSVAGTNSSVAAMLASPVPLMLKSRVPGGDGSSSHGVEVDTGALEVPLKEA